MGFKEYSDDDVDIKEEQIKSILKGKLKHGYSFEASVEDTKHINKDPGVNDKIQIAVIVIAANNMKDIPSDPNKECGMRDKINEVLAVLKKSGILSVFILTKVEVICAEVRKDPTMIFQSRAIYEMVKKVHDTFGPDENDIFPVVNYVTEVGTTCARDIPLLFALRHIVKLASNHAEKDTNKQN